MKKQLLFVNKKKQKNFMTLGHGGAAGTGSVYKKFFGSFFPKKNLSLPS